MKQLLFVFISLALSTLTLNLIAWGCNWLVEEPFDILGWLRIYSDFFNCIDLLSKVGFYIVAVMFHLVFSAFFYRIILKY